MLKSVSWPPQRTMSSESVTRRVASVTSDGRRTSDAGTATTMSRSRSGCRTLTWPALRCEVRWSAAPAPLAVLKLSGQSSITVARIQPSVRPKRGRRQRMARLSTGK
eukprot:scaffold4465_cov47-Phaeocystis_antarctica.AAC.3